MNRFQCFLYQIDNRYNCFRHIVITNRLRFWVCSLLAVAVITQIFGFYIAPFSPLSTKYRMNVHRHPTDLNRENLKLEKSVSFFNLTAFIEILTRSPSVSNSKLQKRFEQNNKQTDFLSEKHQVKMQNGSDKHFNRKHESILETASSLYDGPVKNNVNDNLSYLLNCSFDKLKVDLENSKEIPENYRRNLKQPQEFSKCGNPEMLDPWFYKTGVEYGMIFLVKADPKHLKLRQLVRSGWGKISSLRGMKFATIFIMGRTSSSETQELLKEENEIFGDILQCDFLDIYINLPIKVLSAFHWLLEGHVTSDYYTFTDDDCVMDILRVNTFFRVPRSENVLFCGFIYDENSSPQRNPTSKWFIGNQTYAFNSYPTFCHGGMWTLKRKLMQDLYCVATLTNRRTFHLEDVYITGILRKKLGQGNRNIYPVLTRAKKKYDLMFYPWGDSKNAERKTALKWRKLNQTLPWRVGLENGLMTVYVRENFDDFIELLNEKWRSL